jgi:hypothetical protein
MFDFVVTVFFSIYIASITTLLHILLLRVKSWKNRTILSSVSGIVLAVFTIVLNPQPESGLAGLLDSLKSIIGTLVVPFFILIPLPFVEKRTGDIFNKLSVFSGAFVAAILFIVLSQIGIHLPSRQWQIESLIGLALTIILSFLVFTGIQYIRQSLSSRDNDNRATPVTETPPPASGKRTIIILVAGLLILCSLFFLLNYYMSSHSSCGGFSLYLINDSYPPDGTVIHMTEEKLQEYPKLESAIKKAHYLTGPYPMKINNTLRNVTPLEGVYFSCSEQSQMNKYRSLGNSYSSPVIFLEYEGNLYYAGMMYIS